MQMQENKEIFSYGCNPGCPVQLPALPPSDDHLFLP